MVANPQDKRTSKLLGGQRVTRTRADGSFAFLDLPAGSYSVSASHTGFAVHCRSADDCSGRLVSLVPSQKLVALELRLTPAAVIAGTVVDEDNDPVEGITVYALRVNFLPGGRWGLSARSRVSTDDQGHSRMAGLEPGSYYVRAGGEVSDGMSTFGLKQGPGGNLQYRETYYPATARLDEAERVDVRPRAEANGVRIHVVPEKTYRISGSILSSAKRPSVKPSRIRVEKRGEIVRTWNLLAISPDDQGHFMTGWLSPGEYTLTATGLITGGTIAKEINEGYASAEVVDSDVHADIEIGRAAEVRGQVTAPLGFSFAGKQIILEGSRSSYSASNIGRSGRFDICNVAPGNYTISILDFQQETQTAYVKQALCSGRDYTTQILTLKLGAALDCHITIGNDVGIVGGKVSTGEQAASGLVVVLIPQSAALRRLPRYTLTGTTGAADEYQIRGVPPGDYFLFAVPPNEGPHLLRARFRRPPS